MATCTGCGQDFTPNAYKQVKCNTCRFPQRTGRRPSGVPNPIQWRDIPGYEGRYEINTLGTVHNVVTGAYLTPYSSERGYQIDLRRDKTKTTFWVHRLVMTVFAPIEDMASHTVKCKSKNRHDLSLDNWEWVKDDSFGRARRATLSPETAKAIRADLAKDANLTYADIAPNYHVTPSAIKHVMANRTWKDAS